MNSSSIHYFEHALFVSAVKKICTYDAKAGESSQPVMYTISEPQFYIKLVFKAPLCITLTISDQKIVSGSLFFTEKENSSQFKKKMTFFQSNF